MTTHSPEGAAYSLRGALASLRTSLLARVLLVIAGLAVFALVGRTAGARGEPPIVAEPIAPSDAGTSEPPAVVPAPAPSQPCATAAHSSRSSHAEASPEEPVILNTAQVEDLRRLPGVGAKRAEAILALRTRLGRFRQLEDLLRVRGIGRATLRRLRPLVRLDAAPPTPPPP